MTCEPPRPNIPPGPPAPAPPIGIGIIGILPEPPVAPAAAGTAPRLSPADDTVREGAVDDTHDGGTDIAPTRRAWPTAAEASPPPVSGVSPVTSPARAGTSAAKPAFAAGSYLLGMKCAK